MAGTQKPCVSLVAAEEGGIRIKNDAGREHLAFPFLDLACVLKKYDLNHVSDNFVGKTGIICNRGMRHAKKDVCRIIEQRRACGTKPVLRRWLQDNLSHLRI